MPRVYKTKPLEVRFWEKVAFLPSGCWEWTAGRVPFGYGLIGLGRAGRRQKLAHRLSWEFHHQEMIPKGLVVMHTCDNPPCVNPWHLRLGTPADNQADMRAKGRGVSGEGFGQTKLSDAQIREIRDLRSKGVPRRQVAERVGCSISTVSGVMNRGYRAAALTA